MSYLPNRLKTAITGAATGWIRLYAIFGLLGAIFLLASTTPNAVDLAILAGPGLAYYGYRFVDGFRNPAPREEPVPAE